MPQLTSAQAQQAFRAFLPRYNRLGKTNDTRLIPQLTTGAETSVAGLRTRAVTAIFTYSNNAPNHDGRFPATFTGVAPNGKIPEDGIALRSTLPRPSWPKFLDAATSTGRGTGDPNDPINPYKLSAQAAENIITNTPPGRRWVPGVARLDAAAEGRQRPNPPLITYGKPSHDYSPVRWSPSCRIGRRAARRSRRRSAGKLTPGLSHPAGQEPVL